MSFAYIPKQDYRIGQKITVQGVKMQIESYSHTGKNVIAVSIFGAPKFSRIVCIVTDAEPVRAIDGNFIKGN